MADTFSPTQTQIVPLTSSQYGALRDALEHYYGDSLGLVGSVNVDGPWTDINGIYKWTDKQDFNEKLFDKLQIPVQEINEKFANSLYLELTKREIDAPKTVKFNEAEESPVNANILNRDQQALLNEAAEKAKIEREASDEKEVRDVRAKIEEQKAQVELNKQNEVKQQTPNQTIKQPTEKPLAEDFFKKVIKPGEKVVVEQESPTEETSTSTPSIVYFTNTTKAPLSQSILTTSETKFANSINVEPKPTTSTTDSEREVKKMVSEMKAAFEEKQAIEKSETIYSTPVYSTYTTTPFETKTEIVQEQPAHEEVFQPIQSIYIAPTPQQTKSDEENINNAKNAIIIEKLKPVIAKNEEEIKNLQMLQTELNNKDEKVWVKVSPPPELSEQGKILKDQAEKNSQFFIKDVSESIQKSPALKEFPEELKKTIADQTALNLYETVTTGSPFTTAVITHQVVEQSTGSDKNQNLKFEKLNRDVTLRKLSQYDLYRQLINDKKIFNNLSQQNITVEISQTPQPDYSEYSKSELINAQLINPRIQSLTQENEMLSTLRDFGEDKIKSTVLSKSGQTLAKEIGSLSPTSTLSKFYNHGLTQAAMADVGLNSPIYMSTGTGYKSLMGNYFMSTGYGNTIGEIGKMTGIDFGLIEIASVGTGYSLAGGFSYYTTSALAIEYSGSIFAGEAFAGGAGVAMAPQAIATAAAETGFESIAGFGAYSAPTIATAATAGLESATIATAAATAGGETLVGVGAGAVAGQAAVPIPVVGLIVGAVVALGKKLYSLINSPKVKEFLNKAGGYILGGGVLAAFMGAPLLAIAGIGIGLPVVFASGVGVAGITAGIGNFFKAVGGFLIFTIGIPFIIGLSVFVLLVIFCIFIINNSAYVTPRGTSLTGLGYNQDGSITGGLPGSGGGGGMQNPYIGVTKKANPPGPFQNSDLKPLKVTYTITVTAKKEKLINVVIKDECTIVKESGPQPCSATAQQPPDGIINVGVPFIFTYDVFYNSSYTDSLVTNIVTVTGNVLSQSSSQTASATTSITIGKPPISCPLTDGHVATPDLNYSYNGQNNTGHGSQRYWNTGMSHYAIPQSSGCMSPSDCSYYGYAYDVFSSSNIVTAPTVLGKQTSWNCSYAFSNGGGSVGYTYHCLSTDGNYLLVLTHMNKDVKSGTIQSGEKIGTLFNQGGNTHLHMEFQANGQYVKPETYFCGGK